MPVMLESTPTERQHQRPMLVYADVVMLENQSQTRFQVSQCIPMEAATLVAMLVLPLTFSVGYPNPARQVRSM